MRSPMLPASSCGRPRSRSVRTRLALHPAATIRGKANAHSRARQREAITARSMAAPTQDGELRGQCGKDLQRVLVPFSLVLVQHARWTTTAGRRLVGGQTLSSTLVAWSSAQVIFRDSPSSSARTRGADARLATMIITNV